VASVVIVPDAGLLSLSFDALRDRSGQFVGESRTVTYLSSARELAYDTTANMVVLGNGTGMNFSTDQPSSPPIVLADPAYGPPDPLATHWDALPGTTDDAAEIKRRYGNATIRRGREASRAVLKTITSPSFLHIGSHAFYGDASSRSIDGLVDGAVGPMMAGGIVLAGANAPGVDDDGIASPVDFAGLDLRGTELVFVSGCSSGSGTVRDGEGLYGLRRALRLAGSRSQILALWDVDREATSQFVRAFYQEWSGAATIETAFKAAQRQVRERWERDPYYWAAFTLSGTPLR
jgi:CHAT domain-containing protein